MIEKHWSWWVEALWNLLLLLDIAAVCNFRPLPIVKEVSELAIVHRVFGWWLNLCLFRNMSVCVGGGGEQPMVHGNFPMSWLCSLYPIALSSSPAIAGIPKSRCNQCLVFPIWTLEQWVSYSGGSWMELSYHKTKPKKSPGFLHRVPTFPGILWALLFL